MKEKELRNLVKKVEKQEEHREENAKMALMALEQLVKDLLWELGNVPNDGIFVIKRKEKKNGK